MLWWMLLIALVIWQLLLAAWAVDQAANAARTASRVAGRGGDAREGGPVRARRTGLREGMKVDIAGETATVERAHPDRRPRPRRSTDAAASTAHAATLPRA